MSDRIHRYLDGELAPDELTPDEMRTAADHARTLEASASLLRSITPPDLSASVMVRISAPSHPRWRERTRWLWEPRLVSLRPVYGVLAVAALFLVILLPGPPRSGTESGGMAVPEYMQAVPAVGAVSLPEASITVFVQFRFEAPEASDVRLAGSFTGWEPIYPLQETGSGSWSVLIPLQPGVHDYSFVVDGVNWVPDPAAPRVDDGFGGENSRLALLLSDGERDS